MICENCGNTIDGTFGSGRFCNRTCLISYSNKHRGKHSQLTKLKISNNVSNYKRLSRTCKICNKSFYRNITGLKTSKVFCSEQCRLVWESNKELYVNYDLMRKNINLSKLKNKTFKSSKVELLILELLKNKFLDVKYLYSSELYPFNCDFYIPSLDTYIEFNGMWTHGGKPFENSEDDIIKLQKWKLKNNKFYDNAIYTWTDLDIRKRNIAKLNKLNFLEFYHINDILNWINLM